MASDTFWKLFEDFECGSKVSRPRGCFPITCSPDRKDSCKKYIEYLQEGKLLFENCLQKYIFCLNPCDIKLKPEQSQLILQTFRALQQFIVICCNEYDTAFDECDVETMYRIAERQFSLLDGEFSHQRCLSKCKLEYERCGKKCAMICDKEKNYILPGPTVPYTCIIPAFCSSPVELMKCTPQVDIECFKFLLVQIKVAVREKCVCDNDALERLEQLFHRCARLRSYKAIVRIKICIIAICTDLRTNNIDTTFKRYCEPLICDEEEQFRCNIDPALIACFGYSPQ